jgi:hypothetical protein
MIKYTAWASGLIALSNTGDEVGLLDPFDAVVDVACYEGKTWPNNPTTPHPGVVTGHSIERNPAGEDTDHCEIDFIDQAIPTPGEAGGPSPIPPVIKNTNISPRFADPNEQVTVSSIITDDGQVVSASLYYSLDNINFTTVPYTANPGDSLYSAKIPGQAKDTMVYYYVSATDNEGFTSYDPSNAPAYTYNYRVGFMTIYSIQTVPAGGDSSPYADQLVNISGVVTDGVGTFDDNYFFIEDPAGGKFSAIKVYDSKPSDIADVMIGDNINVCGWVNEYYGMTEINHRWHELNSTGNPLPAALQISTGDLDSTDHAGEPYEAVLVQAKSTIVINDSLGYGEWLVDDDDHVDDPCVVDDAADTLFLTYTPTVGDKRDITGIVEFTYSNYKIEPRGDSDIVQADLNVYANPDQLPIIIPKAGGSFGFTGVLTNNTASSKKVQAWAMVILPTGQYYGPVFGPMSVTVPAHRTVSKHLVVKVPGSAPSGNYSYVLYVGTYPNTKIDQSSFPFSKSKTD